MEHRQNRKNPYTRDRDGHTVMNTLSYSDISPPATNCHNRHIEKDDLEFRTAQLSALIASGSSPAIDFLERVTQPNSPSERHKHEGQFAEKRKYTPIGREVREKKEVVQLEGRMNAREDREEGLGLRGDSPRIAEIRLRYGLPSRTRRD